MQKQFENIILNNLIHNERFTRKVIPHLKPEYFEGHYNGVYCLILDFIAKYNKLPSRSVLEIEFQKSKYINRADRNEYAELISSFAQKDEVEYEWLLKTCEKWCKDRAVHLAVMEAITIIDGKSTDKAEGCIPEILNKALGVTFDTNVGHDYIDNADKRFEFYHTQEDKIEFDLEMFNEITNGGISRKTLNILLAGTGCGKSLAMCHLASAALSQGRNVLYITLEMSEEKIAERIDANLFDVRIDQLKTLNKISFNSKIKNISGKTNGKLIIKEYPTASAHSGHFRALLHELKIKKSFSPDMIFIDYLNICASSRIKGLSGGVNTYSLVKAIAEELRGLAVEFNVPVWSATQVTRCLTLDTNIITEDRGTIQLKDIKLGDKILSTDSKYVSVDKIYPTEHVKVYEIETTDGKKIRCSGKHIFPTSCGFKSIESGLSVNDDLYVLQK